jgi:hypothetical protein
MNETTDKKTEQLMVLIERMIGIIKYDNQYAYQLLQSVTLNKFAVIDIDGCKVFLKAFGGDDYILTLNKADSEAVVQFSTNSHTLQRIIAGNTTIDKAIAENDIFVMAGFHDLLNIYKLTTCLLAEGPLNPLLRDLWQEFNETWCSPLACQIMPVEHQKPCYDFLISSIPENALLVKI